MLSRNKVMINFGHTVIKLLTGIYFYVERRNRNAEELNRFAQWKNTELGFHNDNQLEGYVYKSKGEMSSKHPDTASKIIAHQYCYYRELYGALLGNFVMIVQRWL